MSELTPKAKAVLAVLLEADQAYYTDGKSRLSDAEYDSLREEFKALAPQHPYHGKVGAKVRVDAKLVRHRLISGSQEKLKSPQEIQQWAAKGGKLGYREQWKLDGYTLVLSYEDGVLVEAASRGDGEVGESVLWNAVLLSSIPKRLSRPFTGDVRGECVLSKKKFAAHFAPLGYSNARNAVAVIRDQKGTGLAAHLDFIAFDVNVEGNDPNFATEGERIEFMEELGFTVVGNWLAESPSQIESIYADLAKQRSEYEYEVDGVVVRYESLSEQKAVGSTSDFRPKGQRCIKFANDEAETTCIGYELTMGSTGAIVPTLKFNTVEIGGAKVSSVLGCNFEYLQREHGGINIGDKVVISRRGGVIPHIEEVFHMFSCSECGFEGTKLEQLEQITHHKEGREKHMFSRIGTPIQAPEFCPFCGSATVVDGAYVKCSNEDCEGREFRLLLMWAQKREIKGLGETLLQVLYDEHDIKKPADLYRLTYGQLSQVQLGGRMVGTGAKQVLAEIEKSKQCPLADLVGSVGVKFLGRREAENILEKLGISQLDDLYLVTPEELTRVGYNLKAQIIVDGLKKARPVIDALLEAGVTVPKSKKAPAPALSQGGVLSGHTVVFTGAIQKCDASGTRYTRKKMQELALSAGASVLDDVREGVTMLVLADPDSTSSKTKKAMKLGVKLVHEDDFFSMVGL